MTSVSLCGLASCLKGHHLWFFPPPIIYSIFVLYQVRVYCSLSSGRLILTIHAYNLNQVICSFLSQDIEGIQVGWNLHLLENTQNVRNYPGEFGTLLCISITGSGQRVCFSVARYDICRPAGASSRRQLCHDHSFLARLWLRTWPSAELPGIVHHWNRGFLEDMFQPVSWQGSH